MFEGLNGVVVRDCRKSYDALENVEHSLCNAHILRELIGIIETAGSLEREAKMGKKNEAIVASRP